MGRAVSAVMLVRNRLVCMSVCQAARAHGAPCLLGLAQVMMFFKWPVADPSQFFG